MTDTLELTAKRIADRGRDALLARLRPAFADAAGAHAEILQLDAEQLEQMVQRAADRADGLQWRRALAMVASEELGIGLGEALGHPAVERAQAIVGAPSYEDSLAALEARSDAPVALDRRPKVAPPTDAETRPGPAETKPVRGDAKPTPAEDRPTRPDPEVTRVAQAPPAPAPPAPLKPAPDRSAAAQPDPARSEPRVRRIDRAPSQPERTPARAQPEAQEGEPAVRRIERRPVRPESEVTRVERQPPQPPPESRSAEENVAGPQPKPASAAAAEENVASPQPKPASAAAAEENVASPQPKPASAAAKAGPGPTAPQATPARPTPRPGASSARPSEPEPLRVAAIHLGGVTNLRPGESDIELRLSEHGLDIARQSGEIIGRLGWDEIQGLEVPPPRGLLWRRRPPRSHLVVRAGHGDASFEIPCVYPDELSEHLEPVLERYGRRSAMR